MTTRTLTQQLHLMGQLLLLAIHIQTRQMPGRATPTPRLLRLVLDLAPLLPDRQGHQRRIRILLQRYQQTRTATPLQLHLGRRTHPIVTAQFSALRVLETQPHHP